MRIELQIAMIFAQKPPAFLLTQIFTINNCVDFCLFLDFVGAMLKR